MAINGTLRMTAITDKPAQNSYAITAHATNPVGTVIPRAIYIGTTGTPRIRRCDLPYKPRRSGLQLTSGQPDLADEILMSKLAGEQRPLPPPGMYSISCT